MVSGPDFEASYRSAIAALAAKHGVAALITGDIAECAAEAACANFMPRAAQGTGVAVLRPLWGASRAALLRELLQPAATPQQPASTPPQPPPLGIEPPGEALSPAALRTVRQSVRTRSPPCSAGGGAIRFFLPRSNRAR